MMCMQYRLKNYLVVQARFTILYEALLMCYEASASGSLMISK